jgi:hypothetical protein
MLSAQKQKMSEEPPPNQPSSAASGFGKVLTSLQGLQQRLDDFSVDDVSHAHSQAVELIQQLGNLEARLQKLQSLYRLFEGASTAIETLAKIDFSVVVTDMDGLEKHPRLRAIVRAGKFFETHPHLLYAQSPTDPDHAEYWKTEPAATHALAGASEHPKSATERPERSFHEGPVNTAKPFADTATRTGPSPNTLPVSDEYDFWELKLEDASLKIAKREKTTGLPGSEKSVRSGAFDERLLKDLIDTYGEFAALDKSTSALGPFSLSSKRNEDANEGPSRTALSNEVSSALIVAPDPKVLEPNTAREGSSSISEKKPAKSPSNQPTPNATTRGEIDQQLKNIIKDYGEVDLYSHGKSVNTNITVIAGAAAALLVLILAGFFFFKTPSSSSSASSGASTAGPSIPSAASTKDAAQQK